MSRLRRWLLTMAVGFAAGTVPGPAADESSGPVGRAFAIDYWETDDGLPRRVVIALTQTRDGYLWLGTLNGLVRFDGVHFRVFDTDNTPELPGNLIVHLFEDRADQLWIGTETGAAVVRRGPITSIPSLRPVRENRVVAACDDPVGGVWVYTADGQLQHHAAGEVTGWNVGAERPSNTRTVIAESDGDVWVGVDWGLYAVGDLARDPGREPPLQPTIPMNRLDYLAPSRAGGHWRLGDGRIRRWQNGERVQDLGAYPWLGTAAAVSAVTEDAQGRLIVGTLGAGIYWIDPAGSAIRFSTTGITWLDAAGAVTRTVTSHALSNDYIMALEIDREGALWVGTDGGGLNRIRAQPFEVIPETRGRVVQAIAEDPQGGVWIGYNGGGLDYWIDGRLRRFGAADGLLSLPIRSVLVDRSGGVWVGTWGGGIQQWRQNRFERLAVPAALHPVIRCLHQDRQDRIWIGTQGGLARVDAGSWRIFTRRDGLPADIICSLAEDNAGNLWIGTEGGGLARLADGLFTVFPAGPGGPPGDTITTLLITGENTLWAGTAGAGLGRLHDGVWTHFNTRHGLVSNEIAYLARDDQDHLWIGSPAGLLRAPLDALPPARDDRPNRIEFRVFGRPDGLPTRDCTISPNLQADGNRGSRLWFPTVSGLALTQPQHIRPNPFPPPVVIESVFIEGQLQGEDRPRATLPGLIIVPPRREQIEIHYTSLNLAAANRATFRHRLAGHETRWTDVGSTRVARYSRLPPGTYEFQVTARNEDGLWNPSGAGLLLVIQPPFHRTWWFLSLAGATLLGLLIASVHLISTQRLQQQLARLRQQEAIEKERARIARDLHDQLGASLTQISLLGELAGVDRDLPEEVEAHARQISITARDTTRALDEIVWTVNPSNDTLEGLVTYLCKYAQEFFAVAGLRYRQQVPAQLPNTPLPPELRHHVFLAAKEAMTNVVRHARAGEVHLRLHLDPTRFTLELEDDGCGPGDLDSPAARRRNGLRNMRRRLAEVGGQFEIQSVPPHGTRVRLTAPRPERP